MRKADDISIKEYLIPGIVLMENAAQGIVNFIKEDIKNGKLPQKGKAVIICGTGNNGGDGFAIARHLTILNWDTKIIICGNVKKITGDALVNLNIARKMNIPILNLREEEWDVFHKALEGIDMIIDGILGTGFKGKLRSLTGRVIDTINMQDTYTVSIDIPSGLNSDTGFADGACIMADKTISLGLPEIGQVINEGPRYCGQFLVEGLSISEKVYESIEIHRHLLDASYIKDFFKKRDDNSHKGTYGRALIIAGSKTMTGAALLSAEAALKSGTGIVELGVPERVLSLVSGKIPEIIIKNLPEDIKGNLCYKSGIAILREAEKASALLLGPGIGNAETVKEAVFEVIKNCSRPMVIDADGLNVISEDTSVLLEKSNEIIITPHPKEMARLMGVGVDQVQKDRIGYAESFAEKFDVIVVLKGFRTIVAIPEGKTYINSSGNPGMATAGSGDVLAGIITAFLAQGMKAQEAAYSGAYIHGASGDICAKNIGQWGMTAADIIRFIPHTIKEIGGL